MTKRYNLVMAYPKLKNIVYIASSPIINKPIENETVLAYFDKTFTVYEQEYACGMKIHINCHGKNCMECRNCYKKTGSKKISEILRK